MLRPVASRFARLGVDLSEVSKNIGERVRRFRMARSLTQADAAKRAKVSIQTWSRLERGAAQNHTLETLAAIAAALEVGVDELFVPPQREADTVGAQIAAIVANLDAAGQASLLAAFRALAGRR